MKTIIDPSIFKVHSLVLFGMHPLQNTRFVNHIVEVVEIEGRRLEHLRVMLHRLLKRLFKVCFLMEGGSHNFSGLVDLRQGLEIFNIYDISLNRQRVNNNTKNTSDSWTRDTTRSKGSGCYILGQKFKEEYKCVGVSQINTIYPSCKFKDTIQV